MAKPLPMEVCLSVLLTADELGPELAGVTVTVRTSTTGVTHAPQCRQVRKHAAAAETMTVGELRAAGDLRPCRTCGGAVLEELSVGQAEQLEALEPILAGRLERKREAELAERMERERIARADLIDERAGHIASGWKWKIEQEKRLAVRYPEEPRVATVACADCGADATITFDPRSLVVSYLCSSDPEHGFQRLDDDPEPLAVWLHQGENQWVALSLVAPVIAGEDNAWTTTYATRLNDYRSTQAALEEFNREHPLRLRLTPKFLCGDCGDSLRYWPGGTGYSPRIEAHYSCSNRHEDGKYRNHPKNVVDDKVDRILHHRLRDHPSWVVATELELDKVEVATYADDLVKKVEIIDTHAGAAKSIDSLVKTKAKLKEELDLVSKIRENGALATADLTRYASDYVSYMPSWTFTDLARALLTKRIEVTGRAITVVTHLDEDKQLRRLAVPVKSRPNWKNCENVKANWSESSTISSKRVPSPTALPFPEPLCASVVTSVSEQRDVQRRAGR